MLCLISRGSGLLRGLQPVVKMVCIFSEVIPVTSLLQTHCLKDLSDFPRLGRGNCVSDTQPPPQQSSVIRRSSSTWMDSSSRFLLMGRLEPINTTFASFSQCFWDWQLLEKDGGVRWTLSGTSFFFFFNISPTFMKTPQAACSSSVRPIRSFSSAKVLPEIVEVKFWFPTVRCSPRLNFVALFFLSSPLFMAARTKPEKQGKVKGHLLLECVILYTAPYSTLFISTLACCDVLLSFRCCFCLSQWFTFQVNSVK